MNNKIKIQYCESDPVMARVVKAKFEHDAGWDVVISSEFEETLNIFKEIEPKLFILELMYSDDKGRTGFDILKNIVATKKATTKIIVLTDLSQVDDKKLAISTGADYYFVKSEVSIIELIAEIKAILD